jgi:20S proteasome subunit alpha 7
LIPYDQGYYGCATGKAKQTAKTEIEKIKVSPITILFDRK